GMFVRVRLPIGQPGDQLLVNDRAILSEQGQKKIYVIVKDKLENKDVWKVEERTVTLGSLQDDGLRVVSGKNFDKDSWVMYTSMQQIRPGTILDLDKVDQ